MVQRSEEWPEVFRPDTLLFSNKAIGDGELTLGILTDLPFPENCLVQEPGTQ